MFKIVLFDKVNIKQVAILSLKGTRMAEIEKDKRGKKNCDVTTFNVLYFIYVVTEMQVLGRVEASTKSVPRQIPMEITYTRAKQQLLIEARKMEAPGYEDGRLTCTINCEGLKLQFGRGKLQYQVSTAAHVQDEGKTLRLLFQWTEVTTLTRFQRFA